jgi:transposase
VIPVPPGVRVLIATRPVDFRKGADSLAAFAKETLAQDPFSGAVLVFRSRRADRVKLLVWDGTGLVLVWKRLEQGAFKWPPITDGVMRLSPAQLAALVEGLDWERRETDERQRVQVPYDEGVANHIGPESCAGGREAEREALTGVRVGQPLSGVRLPIRSANALQSAEGNTSRRVIASAGRLRVVVRPWHARTSLTREPRDLRFSPAGRAVGRTVKAGGRRP